MTELKYNNAEELQADIDKGVFAKSAIGDINPREEEVTETIDLVDSFGDTVYKCNTKNAAYTETTYAHYKGLLITDLVIGDKYFFNGYGGSSYRAWAKVKNGVVIDFCTVSSSATLVNETIIVDGTFDTLIYNVKDTSGYALTKEHTETKTINTVSYLFNKLRDDLKPTSDVKKLMVFGDSAVAAAPNWVIKVAEKLGCEQKTFAVGGYTWHNNFSSTDPETYSTCMKLLIDRAVASLFVPDVILTQIGGNDHNYIDQLGSLDAAFASTNWKDLAKDTTIYGGIRFNLERLMELYPNAVIIVGTNFQARGTDRNEVAEALRQVCYRLAIPIIDGNRYSGIGRDTELPTGVSKYTDNPDGLNTATREYPQYCWVEPDGTYTNVTDKSADAVKKYGRYTYDGKHQTLKGENHIAGFMASQILNYARSIFDSDFVIEE